MSKHFQKLVDAKKASMDQMKKNSNVHILKKIYSHLYMQRYLCMYNICECHHIEDMSKRKK